jgi:uncharacterized protein YndB with AHSA1/START domain
MPKLERKLDIAASQEIVWKIIDDNDNYPKWNIVVNEAKKLGEGNYFFKTNVGDITSTRIETIAPERLTASQEGSPMTKIGYILKPKGDIIQATIWTEFDDKKQEPILGIAGEMLLKSLKKYAEYLESGGNPDNFSKK